MYLKISEEQENQLFQDFQNILQDALKDFTSDKNLYSPWIKGKTNLAQWLEVSPQTVNKLLEKGLPVHYMDDMDISFFNKQEVTNFMLHI